MIAGSTSFTVTENYDITQELESSATDAKDSRPRLPPVVSLAGMAATLS